MASVRATTAALRKASNDIAKRSFAGAASSEPLVRTSLYDMHKELGADMVPFAGYELPVLYKGENGGVMKEHLWCRADGKSSLFDVSHMGQVGNHNDTGSRTHKHVANTDVVGIKACRSSRFSLLLISSFVS
jgi:hypothetical protein